MKLILQMFFTALLPLTFVACEDDTTGRLFVPEASAEVDGSGWGAANVTATGTGTGAYDVLIRRIIASMAQNQTIAFVITDAKIGPVQASAASYAIGSTVDMLDNKI